MAISIDDVISDLDDIVERAIDDRNRIGYFAAVYRRVTHSVRDALETDVFQDVDRMERLDVVFAQRFIDAWNHHRAGRTPTQSWKLAFHAAQSKSPLIAQHVLLGMNAHINLDLGVAAATVAPGEAIADLETDFFRLNDLLGQMVRGFVSDVAELSPWIALVDAASGRGDEELIRFSINVARSEAWAFAQRLARLDVDTRRDSPDWHTQWNDAINARDRVTEIVGRTVLAPGPIIGTAVYLARQRETSNVAKVISHLS